MIGRMGPGHNRAPPSVDPTSIRMICWIVEGDDEMSIDLIGQNGQTVSIEPPYELRKPGVSEEEFFRIAGEEDWELHDGVLIMHSPTTPPHELLFSFLFRLFSGYTEERELGVVLGSQCPMRLGKDRIYSPDLLFVSASRLEIIGERRLEGAADLVLEILSPSTREYDLGPKHEVYQKNKIREIWIVDPKHQSVTRERLRGEEYNEESRGEGKLTSEVIPGFWLDPSWLWQDPLPKLRLILEQILALAPPGP